MIEPPPFPCILRIKLKPLAPVKKRIPPEADMLAPPVNADAIPGMLKITKNNSTGYIIVKVVL